MVLYDYWLGNIPGIGNKKIRKLLEYARNAYNIYQLKERELSEIRGFADRDVQAVLRSRQTWDLEGEYEKLRREGAAYITCQQEGYPRRLKQIPDHPYALYVKGCLPEECVPAVAIVGARMCSDFGRTVATQFGRGLAQRGIQVVSGLARGIDSASQRGALEGGGQTFAVLGSGVDVCYPKENISLYMELQEQGGLISEFPLGAQPQAGFFPMRNRLISGLSDAVLVVEAKERSGSLITVDCALEQGREVFAVPGRITDGLSAGCNNLIRQGAALAGSVQDVAEFFEMKGFCLNAPVLADQEEPSEENLKKKKITLAKNESMVYSCLSLESTGLQELAWRLPLSLAEIGQILASLQQKGCVRELRKNYYVKI